jgi:hypothetical protein
MAMSGILAGCAGDTRIAPSNLSSPGGVEGYLTDAEGGPVDSGIVYFYSEEKPGFRGPADFMAEPVGDDGYFITELPPGRYWAVARKRLSGDISGNLKEGDYHTLGAYGPVEVVRGGYARVDMELAKLTGNMLFNVFAGHGDTQGISGVISGRDGSPVAGAYAFAYKDPRMAGKPDCVSEWTGEDGRYVIYVHGPGVYYVGARTGFKGVPRPDEPYGRYDGNPDHSVEAGPGGFIGGIDITLKKFSSGQ